MNQKFRLTKMPFYFFSNWKLWSDLCNSYFVKHCNAFKINSINEAYLCASVFERNLYVALLLQGDQNQIWFLIVVCIEYKMIPKSSWIQVCKSKMWFSNDILKTLKSITMKTIFEIIFELGHHVWYLRLSEHFSCQCSYNVLIVYFR